jgi:hypothetical protein
MFLFSGEKPERKKSKTDDIALTDQIDGLKKG